MPRGGPVPRRTDFCIHEDRYDMELHEIIETRKEAILAAVSTVTGPADLTRVLERLWDELTFRYLEECEEDALREEAAKIFICASECISLGKNPPRIRYHKKVK